jgi:hypothetical protein
MWDIRIPIGVENVSVSAIANNNGASLLQADAQSTSPTASTTDSAANTAATASKTSAETSVPESSTQVTLSPDAQAIANLNRVGITMFETSLAGLNLPPRSSPGFAQALAQAVDASRPPTNSVGQNDGLISQSAFEAVAAQFGATKTQADQIFASLDTDGSGSVSNAELLKAMANTGSDPHSATSQALLKLMDTNGDNTVSSSEFLKFESAMISAEKASS